MNRPSPDDMNDIIMAEQREEIKKLKEKLCYIKSMLDNVKAEYKSQIKINDRLEKEIKMLQNRIAEISKKYIEKDYKGK